MGVPSRFAHFNSLRRGDSSCLEIFEALEDPRPPLMDKLRVLEKERSILLALAGRAETGGAGKGV